MRQQISEREPGQSEPRQTRLDVSNGIGESRSVWLPVPEAARYTGKTIGGFRRWVRPDRANVVPNGLGCYARRDLDKAMAVPRKRHAMSPQSLANLRIRHTAQPSDTAQVCATAKVSEER